MFKMIELVELVLSLAEFFPKLFEFGSGEPRWRICIKRSSPRFCFRNETVSSWFVSGRQFISEQDCVWELKLLTQSWNLRRVLQILVVMVRRREAFYDFTAQACFQYLGDLTFVFWKCLVVGSSGKGFLKLCLKYLLHKIWSFPWKISLVNVTESAVYCGFGHIYWRNP